MMKLLEQLEQSTGYSQATVSNVIDGLAKAIETSLRQGEEVKMERFGIFSIKDMPERIGRNPRTGEEITIPAKTKPIFRFSRTFVNSIQNDPAAEPAPVAEPESESAPAPAPVAQPVGAKVAPPRPASLSQPKVVPPPVPADLLASNTIKNWYIGDNNGGVIEVAETELKQKNVTATTPVWSEETGWKLAKDVPELHGKVKK